MCSDFHTSFGCLILWISCRVRSFIYMFAFLRTGDSCGDARYCILYRLLPVPSTCCRTTFTAPAYKLADRNSPAYANWYYVRTGLAIVIGGCYVVAGLRLALKNRNADPQLRFVSI